MDTNVLVSGIFWGGPPRKILDAWRAGKFTFALSTAIFEEYAQTAATLAKKFPSIDIHSVIDLIAAKSDFYDPTHLPRGISRDPDDDKFVECAISARAMCIVSGDQDLLVVSGAAGVPILKPRQFVNMYL